MTGLRHITIRTKLRLFALVLFGALGAVGGVGYRDIQHLSHNLESSQQYFTTARNTSHIYVMQDQLRALTYRAVHIAEQNDEKGKTEVQAELQAIISSLTTQFGEILTLPFTQEITQALNLVQPLLHAYTTKAQEIVEQAFHGQLHEARSALKDYEQRAQQLHNSLKTVDNLLAAEVNELSKAGTQAAHTAKRTIPAVLVPTLILSLALGVLIARSITRPMREITVAATHIAQGNVEQQVRYHGNDEIGALADAFRELIQYIRTIANAADAISRGDLTVHLPARSEHDILSQSFTRMVGTLRQMSRQTQDSTHVLTEAIGSIVASMHQLAATTTETATSVAQTATTVEEVKQTALVSNNKAQEMSEESRQTLEASQQGVQSVQDVIRGMHHTRDQLESIAQRVAELGTQAQTIGDILATVSDLAERSHLLAINASIQAVKAGDSGKGFSVVAQEIRGLADQSKQATAQVQQMLTDIRQATETAVFATREGAHSATLGAQRSLLAGESIHTLTQNLSASAQAMSQIAASSQQQLVGMDQVATAMAMIKRASAQNAAGIHQVQTVTQNLQTVGQMLTALVEQFVLTKDKG